MSRPGSGNRKRKEEKEKKRKRKFKNEKKRNFYRKLRGKWPRMNAELVKRP